MKVATIILNRNLPDITDRLCDSLIGAEGALTDVFVVEAGSEDTRLSRHCTWHANWPEAREIGLRAARGFNFGLLKLYESGAFSSYDAFFLLTNDTEFASYPVIGALCDELEAHPRVGMLSPCSSRWGEKVLIKGGHIKYFWYVHNTALLLRRQFVESVMERDAPTYLNFLYDGTNFRGYNVETELIAKGYINDWATAITNKVWAEENESHLLTQSDLIRTDSYQSNLKLYVEEGQSWMRKKYGFNSRWQMQMYAKFWYEQFFEFHPEYAAFKIGLRET